MKKLGLFLVVLLLASTAVFAKVDAHLSFAQIDGTPYVDENRKEKAHYTPSAEAKQSPETVGVSPDDEIPDIKLNAGIQDAAPEYIASEEITNEDQPIVLVSEKKGKEGKIVGAVLQINVEIIPYAAKETLRENETSMVYSAFNELKKALEFTDVVPSLKKYFTQEYIGKLAATQIFYIRPKDSIENFITGSEELNLRILFAKSLQTGNEPPVILVKNAITEEWSVIDPKTVLENWYKHDTFSVDFHEFGTVVFLEVRNN